MTPRAAAGFIIQWRAAAAIWHGRGRKRGPSSIQNGSGQYIYNLGTNALGAGTDLVEIRINAATVDSAIYQLKQAGALAGKRPGGLRRGRSWNGHMDVTLLTFAGLFPELSCVSDLLKEHAFSSVFARFLR